MGYVDQTLLEGETIVLRARRHAFAFLRSVLVLIAAAVAMAFGIVPLAAILGIVGFIDFMATWVVWTSTEFTVTNMRVVMKTGIVQRQTSETLIMKVESVDVKQGVLGRMFDFGDVVVRGTGGSIDPFTNLSKPLHFRRAVQEQVVKHGRPASSTATA